MIEDVREDVSDKNRLLLGAGFVFGVAFSMFVLALAAGAVVGTGSLLGSSVLATIAAGVLFATIVGTSLYVLAFPENRLDVPVETLFETDTGRDDRRTERL
jgi:hypothetical protein